MGSARRKRPGCGVIAIPNPHFPPPEEVLELADLRLESLADAYADAVESASSRP